MNNIEYFLTNKTSLDKFITGKNIMKTYDVMHSCPVSEPLIIYRTGDIIVPEYLTIDFKDSIYSINEIKTRLKNKILYLSIGNMVSSFPLNLLMILNEPIICDNIVYINLSFNMFLNSIELTRLHQSEVKFSFDKETISSNDIFDYSITFTTTYYESFFHDEIKEYIMQQISSINVHITPEKEYINNVYKCSLPLSHVIKGLFIECNNINQLNVLRLTINNITRFSLDKFAILTKCIKINDNTIYFPFNNEQSYLDRSKESFEGSINFSICCPKQLELLFDNPIDSINIYSVGGNIFRQYEGLCINAFMSDDPNNTSISI